MKLHHVFFQIPVWKSDSLHIKTVSWENVHAILVKGAINDKLHLWVLCHDPGFYCFISFETMPLCVSSCYSVFPFLCFSLCCLTCPFPSSPTSPVPDPHISVSVVLTEVHCQAGRSFPITGHADICAPAAGWQSAPAGLHATAVQGAS